MPVGTIRQPVSNSGALSRYRSRLAQMQIARGLTAIGRMQAQQARQELLEKRLQEEAVQREKMKAFQTDVAEAQQLSTTIADKNNIYSDTRRLEAVNRLIDLNNRRFDLEDPHLTLEEFKANKTILKSGADKIGNSIKLYYDNKMDDRELVRNFKENFKEPRLAMETYFKVRGIKKGEERAEEEARKSQIARREEFLRRRQVGESYGVLAEGDVSPEERVEALEQLGQAGVKPSVLSGLLPEEGKPFTLGQGQKRFTSEGRVIAEVEKVPESEVEIKDVATLTNMWQKDPRVKDFYNKDAKYRTIEQTVKALPKGRDLTPEDRNILTNFALMFRDDAVREWESRSLTENLSLMNRAKALYNTWVRGGELTPSLREDFLRVAKDIHNVAKKRFKEAKDYYEPLGKKFLPGVNFKPLFSSGPSGETLSASRPQTAEEYLRTLQTRE